MDETTRKMLEGLGFTPEQIGLLEKQGVKTGSDLALLSADDIERITESGIILAKKTILAVTGTPATEIPAAVTKENAAGIAQQIGLNPNILTAMLFTGLGAQNGLDMDMSAMLPIKDFIASYSPKIKDFAYIIMGQVQGRLNSGPIIAINADGSTNAEVTMQYIMSLEEGFPPADDEVYNDESGNPFELIGVGVDAQSIYDADPLDSSRALQKNGIGTGRIAWNNVSKEVRQLIFFGVGTGEILNNETEWQWLRDNINPEATRVKLRNKCPQANVRWNEANRTGTLPTLRVQLSRSPRRPSMAPNRRTASPRDLSEEAGGSTSGSSRFRP